MVDYVSESALNALSLRSLSVTLGTTKISFLPSSWNGPMKTQCQANNELQFNSTFYSVWFAVQGIYVGLSVGKRGHF